MRGDRSVRVGVRVTDSGDGTARAGLLYGYRPDPRFYFMALVPGFRQTARVTQVSNRPEAARAMSQKVMATEGDDIRRNNEQISVDAVQDRLAYETPAGDFEEWATSTTSWELPNHYAHVWKTPTGEFIFTNNINYNPNESLHMTDWERMHASP